MRPKKEIENDIELIKVVITILKNIGSEWPKTLIPVVERLEQDLGLSDPKPDAFHYKVV